MRKGPRPPAPRVESPPRSSPQGELRELQVRGMLRQQRPRLLEVHQRLARLPRRLGRARTSRTSTRSRGAKERARSEMGGEGGWRGGVELFLLVVLFPLKNKRNITQTLSMVDVVWLAASCYLVCFVVFCRYVHGYYFLGCLFLGLPVFWFHAFLGGFWFCFFLVGGCKQLSEVWVSWLLQGPLCQKCSTCCGFNSENQLDFNQQVQV